MPGCFGRTGARAGFVAGFVGRTVPAASFADALAGSPSGLVAAGFFAAGFFAAGFFAAAFFAAAFFAAAFFAAAFFAAAFFAAAFLAAAVDTVGCWAAVIAVLVGSDVGSAAPGSLRSVASPRVGC